MYYINNNVFLWADDLEMIYCLSSSSPPSNCQTCSAGCSYQDLSNSNCLQACNLSQCGYSNLQCLIDGNSYYFMNYNPDICASGCLYSDMRNGLCPLACTGSCFSNCSSMFCSPEC